MTINKKFLYLKEECSICGGKGYKFSDARVIRGEAEVDFAEQCACVKKMMAYAKFDEANIPREYWDLSIDNFKETSPEKTLARMKVKKIIENLDTYHREGKGLLLYGKKGTGKSMLSIEILKAAATSKKGYSVYYDFYPVVFNEYTHKGYKADEVKAKYEKLFDKTDFLVLDELAKEADYFSSSTAGSDDMSKRFLEMNILKKRASRPTILITNLQNGMEDIKKHYGDYVASMISHNFELMKFEDADFREGGK